MRSMQNNELDNKWVGSDISCCNPCIVVNESISEPEGDVMSYELDDSEVIPSLMTNLVQ